LKWLRQLYGFVNSQPQAFWSVHSGNQDALRIAIEIGGTLLAASLIALGVLALRFVLVLVQGAQR
jgi:hypothetical protein